MASASTCRPSPPRFLLPLTVCLLTFHPEKAASFFSSCVHNGRIRPSSQSTHRAITSTLQPRSSQSRPRKYNDSGVCAKGKRSSEIDNEVNVVALIHSHHLLDHKPDNMILAGKKFKLRGVACLGRPGAALCVGPRKNVEKFAGKLRGAMPQKKFGVVEITRRANGENKDSPSPSAAAASTTLDELVNGFERASLGELRELLAAVGQEDQFLALVGVNDLASRSPSQNNPNSVGGKIAARKKKRRKGR